MDARQSYDRKQYLEQIRSSFADGPETGAKHAYRDVAQEDTGEVRGFFRVRFFLAAALFVAFLLIKLAGVSYEGINADTITEQIRRTVSLPDSFPEWDEWIQIKQAP